MNQIEGRALERVQLNTDRDVANARRAVSKAMDGLGARALKRTRFVTAVSEIARNAIVHGGGGEITIYVHDAPKKVSIICEDQGRGIEDVSLALRDGYTTGGGMGRGLGGAQRLCDTFEIKTEPDAGVSIKMSVVI